MCEACSNACPVSAINIQTDDKGFEYPIINQDKCIECGLCKKVCMTRHKSSFHDVLEAKAVALKNSDNLSKSSSGGLFFGLAKQILDEEGVVFGAKYTLDKGCLKIVHDKAESMDDLESIQGSKYVRSSIGLSYKDAEVFLKDGKKVLFTGTPCQIAGLYNYLGKDYDSLITADVICHGTPDPQLFKNYLEFLGKKNKGTVKEFSFRDKEYGWGLTGSAIIQKNNKTLKKVKISHLLSSYYSLFLDGCIYRENCYECEYARGARVSDITMGDFWGIYKEHPEMLARNGGPIDETKGLSCAIINTPKGKRLFEEASSLFETYDSSFEIVQRNNGQLNHPSEKPEDFELYDSIINKEFEVVDRTFWKEHSRIRRRIRYCIKRAKSIAPTFLKR